MSPMQEKFIDEYCESGNATQAAIAAGYSGKTARQKGHELKNMYAGNIQEQIKRSLQDRIPAGLNWLTTLAESAESESVRLGAVKDLLDRAGLKPVERIEQTNIEQMSNEEIQRELDALLKH